MSSIDVVSACLWDLRAQCEQHLRTLSRAQRLVEEYRVEVSRRGTLRHDLGQALAELRTTAPTLARGVEDCAALFDRVPDAP